MPARLPRRRLPCSACVWGQLCPGEVLVLVLPECAGEPVCAGVLGESMWAGECG